MKTFDFHMLATWADRPFKWGATDCCQFTRAMVRARTGIDYGAELPVYRTELEAEQLARQYGGMVGLISHVLEREPVEVNHPGDPVVCRLGRQRIAGIWTGRGVALVTQAGGIARAGENLIIARWCVCPRP